MPQPLGLCGNAPDIFKFSTMLKLLLLLPCLAVATSVFKYPQEENLIMPVVPRCPRDYDEVSPWFEDPDDCKCYYVCDIYGGMVKMCCPAGKCKCTQ